MKKHINLLFLLIASHVAFTQNCNCDHTIPGSGIVKATDYNYSPGDVFCIQAGNYGFFRFIGFEGTKEKPLVFKNCGGKVVVSDDTYAGIEFQQSKYILLTGDGSNSLEYGIKISKSPTLGVSMNNLSTDFEVRNIEITGLGFAGIMAKTDPTCTDSSGFQGKFLLENLNLHHNYIHDINGEGFYIGYTGNYEEGKTNACADKILFGHDVKHVNIHHNKLVNIGWDGIQVSLGTEDVEVHDNYLENPGKNNELAQNSGIQFGSGTVGRIYNNTVIGGTNNGISNSDITNNGITNFGLGPVYIYNNLIVRAGARGIYNDHQKSLPPGNGYYMANNTIISPKTHGIYYINGENRLESPYECYNNLIIDPGSYDQIAGLPSHWSVADIHAYIGFNTETMYKALAGDMKNNIFSRNIDYPKFINSASNNFYLTPSSPAVDAGTNEVKAIFGFDDDLSGFKRIDNFDVGAFELGNPLAANDFMTLSKYISVFPNPITKNSDCFLELNGINAGTYMVSLLPLDGKDEVILYQDLSLKEGSQKISLGSNLSSGVYLVKVVGDGFFQTIKVQIL